MDAYCVKCKAKRQIQDGEKVTMKNGRPAMKGKCPGMRDGALPDSAVVLISVGMRL